MINDDIDVTLPDEPDPRTFRGVVIPPDSSRDIPPDQRTTPALPGLNPEDRGSPLQAGNLTWQDWLDIKTRLDALIAAERWDEVEDLLRWLQGVPDWGVYSGDPHDGHDYFQGETNDGLKLLEELIKEARDALAGSQPLGGVSLAGSEPSSARVTDAGLILEPAPDPLGLDPPDSGRLVVGQPLDLNAPPPGINEEPPLEVIPEGEHAAADQLRQMPIAQSSSPHEHGGRLPPPAFGIETSPGGARQVAGRLVIDLTRPQAAPLFGQPQITEIIAPQLKQRGADDNQITAIATTFWDGVDLTIKTLAATDQ